ncbi:D-2-hydroxyacid dehydrogenase [Helicobacter sp. 23-1045]
MNIVLLDAETLGSTDLSAIERLGRFSSYQKTAKKDIIKRAKDADIILTNKVVLDSATLAKLPKLKLICITATGMNNIDLEAAKKLKIAVKNVANYSTASVAQHTLACVLNAMAKLNYYDRFCKKGEWSKSAIFNHLNDNFELYELQGKSWGIIGLGNIGKAVANLALAFGANVAYFSTSGKNDDKKFKREKDLGALFKNCDIISIHAPLNESTKNLITKKELRLLKKDAILANMGRGGIVNEADLASALKKRDFYFTADVLEVEPMTKKHALLDKKLRAKILLTPHIAWAYKESRERLIEGVEKNIKEFLDKKQ